MQYTQGSLGRVFVARLDDGESIYQAAETIASREDVTSALVLAIGGMRSGAMVTGPEQPDGPIVPHLERFDDARELVGVGTLFAQADRPSLHFHAAVGRGSSALVGCPREGMETFLVLEVIILELVGVEASRVLDACGLHLLQLRGADGATGITPTG